MVGLNIISHTNSNLIDPDDPTELTPETIKEREFGSKIVLVVEQMQCLVSWSIKACVLILYGRFTFVTSFPCFKICRFSSDLVVSASLKNHLAVKIAAVYVGVGLVVMEVLYFGVWCRPFTQYWTVPPESSKFRSLDFLP
jgi:hypothetical protein